MPTHWVGPLYSNNRANIVLAVLSKKKQMSLKSLETVNQLLGSTVIQAEQLATHQHKICEVVREEHHEESKILISLKEELHCAKAEMATLATQTKGINDDISRADELIFKEQSHHHTIDSDRTCIENAIASFNDTLETFDQRKASNEAVLVQLGRTIDSEHIQRDLLRQKYRRVTGEKDIVISHLVAVEVERVKADENLETLRIMNKASEDRHRVLKDQLKTTQDKTKHLNNTNTLCEEQKERQKERKEILAALEHDLSKQYDKNSALAAEIGRPINLHRWRYLRDKAPAEFMMLEKIQSLQRQAIETTSQLAHQSRNLKKKHTQLSALELRQDSQESLEDVSQGLSRLKSELHALNKEIKLQEDEVQTRIAKAKDMNCALEDLEKKRMEMKANYVVSVIGGCSEFVGSL